MMNDDSIISIFRLLNMTISILTIFPAYQMFTRLKKEFNNLKGVYRAFNFFLQVVFLFVIVTSIYSASLSLALFLDWDHDLSLGQYNFNIRNILVNLSRLLLSWGFLVFARLRD